MALRLDPKAHSAWMVPHHSGAVLMCEMAHLKNGELKDLCDSIIKGQNEEIEQMIRILAKL